MKIVCIGASYLFVHNVVKDLALSGKFENSEIVVVDIVKEPLEIVVDACRTILSDFMANIKISGTLNRREALKNADFIFLAISVGGFQKWQEEIDICLNYGIGHAVGDTIGPAALSRSLRILPVILDIARDIEEICPDAWLINVTNPMTVIVKALSVYTKVKVLGLCHGSLEMRECIAKAYNVGAKDVSFKLVGVNHFTFAKDISICGKNVMKTFLDDIEHVNDSQILAGWELGRELFRLIGYMPLTDDKHLCEFFPFYLGEATGFGAKFGIERIDIQKRIQRRNRLETMHKNIARNHEKIPDPDKFSGEGVHEIMSSLYYGFEGKYIVNIPNSSFCEELKKDSVIEAYAHVSKNSVRGLEIVKGEFDPHLMSTLYNLNVIYDYTVEAAVEKNKSRAIQALSLDPMLRDMDIVDLIPRIVDQLFEINNIYVA